MPGRAQAPRGGRVLVEKVAEIARNLGLHADYEVTVARRIWGAERRIDLVLTGRDNQRLGIECKFQGTPGSAEEKIPATIQDIRAWPIRGIVVFDGEGFSHHMRVFLVSSGLAVHVEDVEAWLRLFFGLDLPSQGQLPGV